jgi:Flp pilus assembly protein TadD
MHVTSLARASLLALVIFTFAVSVTSGQQQATAVKPNRATTEKENIASLLRDAASLLQNGKLDEAEPFVRRAIAAAPSNPDAHNLWGAILDQRGQTQAAEREYLQAV